MSKKEKKIFLCSVVWGEEYIEYFENFCLKSLLDKNIYKSNKTTLNIYCLENEFKKIINLQNIKKISRLITINYFFLKEKKNQNKYKYLSIYQKKLIGIAKEKKYDHFIFCYPDTIFCNHFLKFCKEKLKKYSILLSPAPLVSFEKLPKNLNNFSKNNLSRIGNNYLSNFYKNRIGDFYKRSNINIYKNKYYSFYKCFNLHILAVKLSSIKIFKYQKSDSFDEDFFTKDIINLNKSYYVKNSQENIVLTVESITTDRNNDPTDKRSIANKIINNSENLIYAKMKREKNLFNIYSFLYSNYYVVEKKYLSKIEKCEYKKSLNFIFKIFPKKRREFDIVNTLKRINPGINKEDTFLSMVYDYAARFNFERYIIKQTNKIGTLLASIVLIILILIPKEVYPILNKLFSRKNLFFNRVRNSYKFILLGSPKKYILKHCIKNIIKIFKYA